MSDLYTRNLEREIERSNRIISQLGELIDEGVYTTTVKSAHRIFKAMGEVIGLNMEDIVEESDIWDDYDDDEMLEDGDPYD
jgi:hypothetical protein